MSTLFAKKLRRASEGNGLDKLVESIRSHSNDRQIGSAPIARASFAMESLQEAEVMGLQTAVDQLSNSLESIASDLHINKGMTQSQFNAGIAAGLLAGDVKSFLRHPVNHNAISTENMAIVQGETYGEGFATRTLATEAYDEKDNRNAMQYSVAYNMQAARQDEFGETLFPTIVVTPDNVGYAVSVRLFQVYNDFHRNVSGAIDDYQKKNIIRGLIDSTILKNEMTRIIPVYRAESAANFVPVATIPQRTILLEGEPIVTSPLAVGKRFSLLGLSQTDTLLANGVMDTTDSIEPAVKLQNIYVQVGDDILSFNVENLPLSNFTGATQGLQRQMNLIFQSTSLLLTKTTKQLDGTAPVDLVSVTTNDLIVRLGVNVTGSINIEQADTVVHGNGLEVISVQNAAGESIALTAAPAAALVALVATGKIIGYDLVAYRTNLNRRQRGQLIDTTFYTQVYQVPMRSPITAIRPVTSDGQTDTSDLAALITATHIRASNAAVTTLLQTANLLNEYVDARDTAGVGPDVLGVGRFLVRPTFAKQTIDMLTAVDSIKSQDRARDTQSVLINAVRDMAYRMYRDSGYKAASDAQNGERSKTPTVILATDQILSRYLIVEGDLRTLGGGEFDVRIVATQDERMVGRIAVTFGMFDGAENTPNALHFGNMAWKPELTLVLPISRGGQTSKELTVQPSFLHVVNCPILGMIEVKNVPDVMTNKVALYQKVI